MDFVEKYYMKKANMATSDVYYQALEQRDIEVIKRCYQWVFIAPTLTIGFIYLLKQLRFEILIGKHFFYYIQQHGEKMKAQYARKPAKDAKDEKDATQAE